ncbi:MAG: T9SS type B sorting domain-containing protein [Paludibacteraceae bacterium]|nr:T9SS type B sorting domain-containing protein [Paludibacteraceae bacterium]
MKTTRNSFKWLYFLLLLTNVASSSSLFAQVPAGASLVWREDFGVVEDSARADFPDPSMSMPGHKVQLDMKEDVGDGYYALANSPIYCLGGGSFFKNGRDHTGNKDGAMLVVNTMGTMEGSVIYEQTIDFPLCNSSDYYFNLYAASATSFTCIQASLILRILADDGTLIDEKETGDIPWWEAANSSEKYSSDPHREMAWTEYGIKFNASGYKSIKLQVVNNAKCREDGKKPSELESWESCDAGNDFVLDDISLYRIDKEAAPDAEVSAATLASESKLNADCIYTSSYTIPESTLEEWKKVYPVVYLLWQESENGYTWKNMTDQSGVDALKMEAQVDITKKLRYRVIITGADNAAGAKTVAEEIAEFGGPKDGCYKFSISNTLAAAKPQADCTYSDDLKMLFKDDFGSVTDKGVVSSAFVKYKFAEKISNEGEYGVTADPANMKANSWDGISSATDHTGNKDGGMLVVKMSDKSDKVVYSREVTGPFCNCKTYMFSLVAKINQSWTDTYFRMAVLDDKGDTLGVLPVHKGAAGSVPGWTRYTCEFMPDKNYKGTVTVQILNEQPAAYNQNGRMLLFDDLCVAVCGDKVPQDSIYIDNTPGLTSASKFDCSELPAKTINISSMKEWKNMYSTAAVVWQSSLDGGKTWTMEDQSGTKTSITFENEDGGEKLYRAVVAENLDVAINIASGKAADGCDNYLITNTVSLTCEEQCHFGTDKLVLWKDDFGTVPPRTRKENKNLVGHSFLKDMKKNVDDGQYAVVSRMKDAGDWFAAMDGTDHTGNADGGFLVINIDPDYKGKLIYEQELGFQPCASTPYFFSLFASSISKRVVNEGTTKGQLCNLTMEIVDASDNVLATIETGNMPNAPLLTGPIPWVNYGVSFVSDGTKIKLRIRDNAGNGSKGNDLAIDDISLIACQTKAPEVELKADAEQDWEGLCGEKVTLSLGDLSGWQDIYPGKVYCLWQKSADGGDTWENLSDKSGNADSYSSLEVLSEKNKVMMNDTLVDMGYQYRVIVAGPEAEVTKQISEQGYPDNGCYVYGISNVSSVKCHCEQPEYELLSSPDTLICGDGTNIALRVKQTNTTNIDSVLWYTKAEGDLAWSRVEDSYNEKLIVAPTVSASYLFLGYNDECVSDSIIIKVKADQPIEIDTLPLDTLCEGGNITLNASVKAGTPVSYVWNGKEGTTDSYTISGISKDEAVTLTVKGEACVSKEEATTIYFEKDTKIGAKLDDQDICGYEPLTFQSGAEGQNIQWYRTHSGKTEFLPIDGETSADYSFTTDSTRTYKVVASGVKCQSKELTANVVVTLPSSIDAAIDKEGICVGENVTITVDLDHVTTLKWLSRKDDVSPFVEFDVETLNESDKSTSKTLTPTATTQYKVQVPGESGACSGSESKPITVEVDQPIEFSWEANSNLICSGTEIVLKSTLLAGMPTDTLLEAEYEDGTKEELKLKDGELSLTPHQTGTYILSYKGKYCNSWADHDVTVEVEQPIRLSQLTVSEDKVCENSVVSLNYDVVPEGAQTKLMVSENGTDFTEGALAALQKDTWYKVVGEAGKICSTDETNVVKVEVEDSIRFEFIADKAAICENDLVKLSMNINSGNIKDGVITNDADADIQSVTASGSYSEKPLKDVIYTAELKGEVCPSVTRNVAVEVHHPAHVALTADKTKICQGESVTITEDTNNSTQAVVYYVSTDGVNYQESTDYASPTQDIWVKAAVAGSAACPGAESNIVAINVEQPVVFECAQPEQQICEGAAIQTEVQVNSGNVKQITWFKDGVKLADGAKLNDKPLQDASYKAVLTADLCSSDSILFDVKVEQQPKLLSVQWSDAALCEGGQLNVTVLHENTNNLQLEKMEGSGSFVTIAEGVKEAFSDVPAASSTYRITSKAIQYCKDTVSLAHSVSVTDSVRISMTADQTICPGVSKEIEVAIEKGTPSELKWEELKDGGYEPMANHTINYMASPKQTTTYRVTAVGGVCPDAVAMSQIEVEEVPELTVSASASAICEGGEVELSASFVNENVTWLSRYAGELVFAPIGDSKNVTEYPSRSMEYQAKAQSDNNCPVESEIVSVHVDKQIVAITSDTFVCEGGSAHLSVYADGNYNYTWYGDAAYTDTLAKKQTMTVTPEKTATYYMQVINGLCTLDLESTVEVLELPRIVDLQDLEARRINIVADGGNGGYEFNYGKGWNMSSVFEDFHFGTQYTIQVRDAKGCQSDTTFTTSTYDIKVPSIITPDGDGDNDYFAVENLDKYPDAVVRIYDRWGKKIVEYDGGAGYEGWDGTYNGKPMPSTDYWYDIWVEELRKSFTGHFTLLR